MVVEARQHVKGAKMLSIEGEGHVTGGGRGPPRQAEVNLQVRVARQNLARERKPNRAPGGRSSATIGPG